MKNTTLSSEQNAPAVVKFNGPWHAEDECVNSITIKDAFGGRVAEIITDGDEIIPEMWVNAHLIAAAPDMLDALRQWKYAQDNKDAVEMVNAQISRDLAVAKAVGGNNA